MTDSAIAKTELYDTTMMENILALDTLSSQSERQLKAYKKRREGGNRVRVTYQRTKIGAKLGIGRMYAQAGMGMQAIEGDIRAALAQKYYWDIDMVNAQPVILRQICIANGWVCDRLTDYVQNRSARLTEIMQQTGCTRAEAKDLCICVMFGGRPRECPPFVAALAEELARIEKSIVAMHPEILKACAKQDNPRASCVAFVLQDIEFKLLQCVDRALEENGRHMDTLIHDGGLVRKLDCEEEFPVHLLREVEERVLAETGYSVALAVKPLQHSFEFDGDCLMRIGKPECGVTEAEYQDQKTKFEQDHFYCCETGAIMRFDGRKLDSCSRSDAPATFATYNIQKIYKNKIHTFCFVSEWLGDKTKRSIRKFAFQPSHDAVVPPDSINLFNGLGNPDEPECPNPSAVVERFKLLVNQNAGKLPEMYDYMLKWYALAVQKPNVIPQVALILATDAQGVGKDTVALFVGTKVIGSDYYFHTRNIENDVFDTHSVAFDRKLFHHFEEVNGSLNRKYADILKSIITAPIATVNPKGSKKYTIEAYPHIVMTTNNTVPVKIEPSDRRFCISRPADDYMGNMPFWTETYQLLMVQPGAGRAVRDYLNSIDLTEFVPQNFPKGDYHQMLSESEEQTEKTFARMCEPFEKLTGTEVHTLYVDWCRENKFEPKSCVHFCRCLTPMVVSGELKRSRDNMKRSIYTKLAKEAEEAATP